MDSLATSSTSTPTSARADHVATFEAVAAPIAVDLIDPAVPASSAPDAEPRRRSRLGRRIAVGLAITWLALVALSAVFADLLPLDGYADPANPPRVRPSFSFDEPFGTDTFGRSMLTRVIYGTRVSLAVGVASVSIAMLIGGTIGLVAGYFKGKFDTVISIVTDAFLAFPPLILLMTVTATLGASLRNLIIGLTVVVTPGFVRLARANAMMFAPREFVAAARGLGATQRRIVFREILPNIMLPVASYAFLVVAVMIVAEGSLSFLGLGVPPPTPSWGGMIASGQADLSTTPHLVFVPATVLFATVFALNVVGDWARTRFDVKESAL